MVHGVNGHHFQTVPQAVCTVMRVDYMLAVQVSWYQQDDATTPGKQYTAELSSCYSNVRLFLVWCSNPLFPTHALKGNLNTVWLAPPPIHIDLEQMCK